MSRELRPRRSGLSPTAARNLAWQLDPARTLLEAGLTPDPWQQQLLRQRPHRALVVASRQTGKSTTTAAYGLHTAATRAGSTIIIVTPTQRQSSEMLLRVRALAAASPQLRTGRESALSLELRPSRGRVLALPGTPTAVRGYTADLAILDEAAYIPDDTYRALRPTLAATGGALIALSTPGGRRGWYYHAWNGQEEQQEEGEDTDPQQQWERVAVTAEQNPRISAAFLTSERAELGEAMFRQEYYCEFIASQGAVLDPALLAAAEHGTLDDEEVPDYVHAWRRMRQTSEPAR